MKTTRIPGSKAHADSEAIAEKLRSISVGDIYTHKDAEGLLGYGPKHPAAKFRQRYYSRVRVAMNILRKDGLVFEAVNGQGYKRLNDAEIVDKTENGVTKIRRRAKKTMDELKSTDRQALSQEDKARYDATRSQVSLAMFATSRATKNKIIKGSADISAGLTAAMDRAIKEQVERERAREKRIAN